MRIADASRRLALVGSTGTTVLVLVAALVLLGVAMICLTVWLVRSTRRDHVALGPLEVMGDRGFRREDPDARAGRLTGARPDGAPAPAPIVPLESAEEVGAEAPAGELPAPAPDQPPAAGPEAPAPPAPDEPPTERSAPEELAAPAEATAEPAAPRSPDDTPPQGIPMAAADTKPESIPPAPPTDQEEPAR